MKRLEVAFSVFGIISILSIACNRNNVPVPAPKPVIDFEPVPVTTPITVSKSVTEDIGNCLLSRYPGRLTITQRYGAYLAIIYEQQFGQAYSTRFEGKSPELNFLLTTSKTEQTQLEFFLNWLEKEKKYYGPCEFAVPKGINCFQPLRRSFSSGYSYLDSVFMYSGDIAVYYLNDLSVKTPDETELLKNIMDCVKEQK